MKCTEQDYPGLYRLCREIKALPDGDSMLQRGIEYLQGSRTMSTLGPQMRAMLGKPDGAGDEWHARAAVIIAVMEAVLAEGEG